MLNSAKTLPGRLRPVVDEQEFARQTHAEILDGVLDVAKSATRIAFFLNFPANIFLFRCPAAAIVQIS